MITVYGYLGSPSAGLVEACQQADVVVGGKRQLDRLAVPEEKRIVLGALTPAVEKVTGLDESANVVIIASGDPLWFGVVRKLRSHGLRPKVVSAPSSVAEAFARVGLPWDDSITISAHGRPLAPAIEAAKKYTKVAVMTDHRVPLAELAEPLAELGRTFVLAERLGEDDERVRIFNAAELAAETDVRQPNVVLVLAKHPDEDSCEEAVYVAAPRLVESGQTDVLTAAGSVAKGCCGAKSATPVKERLVANSLDELKIGQVVASKKARARVSRIDQILGVETVVYDEPSTTGLVKAFAECDLVISHLALGATTRIIAPLLQSKKTDPGVLVIDQGGRFVVPLVGGHVGGANELAVKIAEGLQATPVVTTATDSLNIPALDTLGWAHSGDVAGVTSAMLDGEEVQLVLEQRWPMPPLPENVREECENPVARIVVTDHSEATVGQSTLPTVVLHPDSLVVGMGCNRGTSVEVLRGLLEETMSSAGLSLSSIKALTSVDVKSNELGLIRLAKDLGVPFVTYPAETLADKPVPNPSKTVAAEVGTPSVSEASVLAHGAQLIVPKHKNPEATCAIGRIPVLGQLRIVGLGPGSRDLLTPMARKAIENATVVVGYTPYVRQIKDLCTPGIDIHATKMGTELERTSYAIQKAREGHKVTLVCSGDPAIYAMASPTLELGTEGVEVTVVPGITAELAASALLGAFLGHDHVTISLSDLHTSWADIEMRLQAAADGDFVTVLYNPRSRSRTMHLPRALEILSAKRPPETPVALVHEAFRPHQEIRWATIAEFDPTWVNMNTIVLVGSSTTKTVPTGVGEQLLVTPRDYQWMGEARGGHC